MSPNAQPTRNRVSATSRTAVYGPVRTGVWEGRSREAPPYPDRSDFVLWHISDLARCPTSVRNANQSGHRRRGPRADLSRFASARRTALVRGKTSRRMRRRLAPLQDQASARVLSCGALEKLSAQQPVELRCDIAKEAALRRLGPPLTN